MFKIKLKLRKNGNKIRLDTTNEKNVRSFREKAYRQDHLGLRSVWSGSLQYDGVYTLKHIPRKRN